MKIDVKDSAECKRLLEALVDELINAHDHFAIASDGLSSFLQTRLASEPAVMKLRLRDTRRFVETRLQNLQSLFDGEPRCVRAVIAQHVQKIKLTPAGKNYIASGVWDWLGSTRMACNSHKTQANIRR